MENLSNTFKRVLNALSYDNVGNLGELRRKLRETGNDAPPQDGPRLYLAASNTPMLAPARQALAR
jgi:hypothetical protein